MRIRCRPPRWWVLSLGRSRSVRSARRRGEAGSPGMVGPGRPPGERYREVHRGFGRGRAHTETLGRFENSVTARTIAGGSGKCRCAAPQHQIGALPGHRRGTTVCSRRLSGTRGRRGSEVRCESDAVPRLRSPKRGRVRSPATTVDEKTSDEGCVSSATTAGSSFILHPRRMPWDSRDRDRRRSDSNVRRRPEMSGRRRSEMEAGGAPRWLRR